MRQTTGPLILPAAVTAPALGERAALAAARHGETVLVVNDEETVRMLITDVAEELGDVAMASGGGNAGRKILKSAWKISLLSAHAGLRAGCTAASWRMPLPSMRRLR